MRKYWWWVIPALFLMVLSGPRSLRADTINQTLSSQSIAGLNWTVNDFNPADGTLTSITVTVSGSPTWDATTSNDGLDEYLDGPNSIVPNYLYIQDFNEETAGNYTINAGFTENITSSAWLTTFTGTGTNSLDVSWDFSNQGSDTVTGNLGGTLTYNYTPIATPEPSTALLLLIGLAALVVARKRFAGGADATA